MPTLTVAIPTYNRGPWLIETIESVLAQTYADFELLVVDNRSTDDTVERVQSLDDPRLRLIVNARNLGAIGNVNRCMELAAGTYVYVMHDDDLMEPENLARKVAFLEANPTVAFVHSAFAKINAAGELIEACFYAAETHDTLLSSDAFVRRAIVAHNTVCCPSVLMRREAAQAAGGVDPRLPWAGDVEYWARLAALGDVGYLSSPLLRYRIHGSNDSRNFDDPTVAITYDILSKRFMVAKLGHRLPDAPQVLQAAMLTHARHAIAHARVWRERGHIALATTCARLALWATPAALPLLQNEGLDALVFSSVRASRLHSLYHG